MIMLIKHLGNNSDMDGFLQENIFRKEKKSLSGQIIEGWWSQGGDYNAA